MIYYFVNVGNEFGETPFFDSKPFFIKSDAEAEYDKLNESEEHEVVALYLFDGINLKIETLKCSYDD